MRRHLIIVMVGIVAGALLLAGAGTYLLAGRAVRHDDAASALREARQVATEVPLVLHVRSTSLRRSVLAVLRDSGGVRFVVIGPDGSLHGRVPDGLSRSSLHPGRLLAGFSVAGTSGDTAYALVPLEGVSLPAAQELRPGSVVTLLLVQKDPGARLGLPYLLAVSGAALVLAAVVAMIVSRRISGPLVDAVTTTRRIADGDLTARVREEDASFPELASLTSSINTMASSLSRSRALERQFLLAVSHDLRTPLTSILGYAEAIGDGTVLDAHAAAGVIVSESRRLERLVTDLLELARLDSQQFSLHRREVNAADVVRAATEGLRHSIEDAGVTLSIVAPEAVHALIDPDRLAQVVCNLVENAYKYAAGNVQVWIGEDPATFTVVVDDDGPGIPPEEQPKVFQRFVQGSGRHAARQGGSGLGLAIVAELVGAMGGTVAVRSPIDSGGGTRMHVLLPRGTN